MNITCVNGSLQDAAPREIYLTNETNKPEAYI